MLSFQGVTLEAVEQENDFLVYQKYGKTDVRWDEFVKSGLTAFDSGNLGTAEMFFQRAIARGCNDFLVYSKVGLYYESLNNYKRAMDYFKRAERLRTQYPDHQLSKLFDEMMGRALYMSGQAEQAEPYLKKAAGADSFMAVYLLGQLTRERGNFEDAIKLFERALNMKHPTGVPPSIDILIMQEIGKAYFALKKYDESLVWWDKILTIDPSNAVAQTHKGNIEKAKFKEYEKKVIQEITQ
jgi:tetratricopeptide (TPR) repeat protein